MEELILRIKHDPFNGYRFAIEEGGNEVKKMDFDEVSSILIRDYQAHK